MFDHIFSPQTNLPLPSILAYIVLLTIGSLLFVAVYRLYFHALADVPCLSPLHAVSSLPLLISSYHGNDCTLITKAFVRLNTSILRVGPNEVVIADGAALNAIYVRDGGMTKSPIYRNFDIGGFATLFSAVDRVHRKGRANAVVGMFSTRSIAEGRKGLEASVADFCTALKESRERAMAERAAVDVLDLARRLAVDFVTGYLFGRGYGGFAEMEGKLAKVDAEENVGEELSASGFVNAFVGVGRFFFAPQWLFGLLDRWSQRLFETAETKRSMDAVDRYVQGLVDEAKSEDGTYQARMLRSGLSKEEVVTQCEDLMFAGTDSSGMNVSTFCWQLAKRPDVYEKVRTEVQDAARTDKQDAKQDDERYNPASLPYLQACIKETLRLSMANPTRLPRMVPKGGWLYTPSSSFSCSTTGVPAANKSPMQQESHFIPEGTQVSIQIHTLHHSPAVFSDPYAFRPERWLDSSKEQLEIMNRDLIPFSLGSRQCIARNLASTELNMACAAIVEYGLLDSARPVGDRIEILEWFNSKVVGEKIELEYRQA